MKKGLPLSLLSRYRKELCGLGGIMVLFFHMPITPNNPLLLWLKHHSLCGVEVLTLLSGLGLYYSYGKHSLGTFYRHRLLRILPSAWLTVLLFGPISLSSMLFFPYWWGRETLWYVSFILTMYAIYPLIYLLIKRSRRIAFGVLALCAAGTFVLEACFPSWMAHCGQAIDRIPIFLLGSLIASLMEEDKTIPLWLPIVGILFFAVGQVFMMRNGDLWYEWLCLLYLIMVPSAALLFGKIAEHFNRGLLLRFLAFMGSISLELYLLYSRIYYRMRIISAHLPQRMWLVLSVPLTVLIAWLFKKVTDEIAHRMQNLKG